MTDNKTGDNIQQNAEKILNVRKADVVNFYEAENKGSKKIYSKFFTKELISQLTNDEDLPSKLNFTKSDDWVDKHTCLKEAQSHIDQSFIWVIGEELRRMFVIGTINNMNDGDRIAKYIFFALRAYRSGLQLMNYVLLSKLFDEKIKIDKIDTNRHHINKFFTTENDLELVDLRLLFQELINVFNDNPDLYFPFGNKYIGEVDQFIQSDSDFNQACSTLEELLNIQGLEKAYSYANCETAEKSLAVILSKLIFLTKYQLVSVKHIEYEESRNNAPQYIKEMRIIKLPSINRGEVESDAMDNLIQTLMYDETPQKTNSVLFHEKAEPIKNSINLFPFIIDKNALDDQREFDLYYYEHLNIEELKLRYYSTRTGNQDIEYIEARMLKSHELKKDKALEKFIIEKRIELVSKQFQLARNIILNDDFKFSVENDDILH